MTHDGSLSLSEPADPESFSAWNQIDQFYPYGKHHRGTEARFRLSFHQSESPCANALLAGLDIGTISLAVSALCFIKVYRTARPKDPSDGSYRLCEMLQIEIASSSINEVGWAPGCLHPFDVIAVACDDGTVRVFHVNIINQDDELAGALATRRSQSGEFAVAQQSASRNAPSGISAGLSGMTRSTTPRSGMSNKNVTHVAREVARLPHDDDSPVWKVRWIYDGNHLYPLLVALHLIYELIITVGSALASTGDNGKIHLWKESLSGEYVEFADTESM